MCPSNPLEGENASGVFIAVVFGLFNLRRVCMHACNAFRQFYSGVDELNKGRVVRVENHAEAAPAESAQPAKKQERKRQ